MRDVKVNKAALLITLRRNRDAHLAIFNEAVTGYQKALEVELEQKLADVRAGKRVVRLVYMPVPEDHTKDYDRVVQMLEMSVDDEIVLAEADVAVYVMDDWAWKRNFLQASSTYSKMASDTLIGMEDR